MKILILATSDRGFCLGVDTEDDFRVLRLQENCEVAIGDMLEGDFDGDLLFGAENLPGNATPRNCLDEWSYSLEAAIAALVKLGQPERIQTIGKSFSVSSPEVVGQIKAALFPDQAGIPLARPDSKPGFRGSSASSTEPGLARIQID